MRRPLYYLTAVLGAALTTGWTDGQLSDGAGRRPRHPSATQLRVLDPVPGLEISRHRPGTRRPLAIGRSGVITRPADQPFSIFVIPDTQAYADGGCYDGAPCFPPRAFDAQTRYVRRFFDHPANNGIFVAHLGDLVDDANRGLEWRRARRAMVALRDLGGRPIPYGISPGNHDFISWRDGRLYPRSFTRHFSLARYRREHQRWHAWLRGDHGGMRNTAHLFDAGGDRYMILFIEYCPGDATVRWARGQLRRYAGRRAIIVTHSAIDHRGSWDPLCDAAKPGSSGRDLWRKLIAPAPNVHFVLAGHAGPGGWNVWTRKWTSAGTISAWWRDHGWTGGTYAKKTALDGHRVHVLLSNYQHLIRGGDGFMRRIRFIPRRDLVQIVTFSPFARRVLGDDGPGCTDEREVNDPKRVVLFCNNLSIHYEMNGAQVGLK